MYSNIAYKKVMIIIMVLILLFISVISFLSVKSYNNPTLVGKWWSLETGEKVSFDENGLVRLSGAEQTGRYTILSSSKMSYTIDNKTFTMYYHLKGRSLSWGTDEAKLESFIKSSF